MNQTTIKYVKQKLIELKREIDKPTITVGHFNTSLSIIARTTRQKISKYIEVLNNTTGQEDPVTFIEHSTQQQENTHSFQMFLEHIARQTLSWAIRQTSTNIKELKLYRVCSLIQMKLFQINNLKVSNQ